MITQYMLEFLYLIILAVITVKALSFDNLRILSSYSNLNIIKKQSLGGEMNIYF